MINVMVVPYRVAPGYKQKRPLIRLWFLASSIPMNGLVDTGSDSSAFPLGLGVALGLRYDASGEPAQGRGVGAFFDYFVATNDISANTEVGPITFRRPLLIVSESDLVLLGRRDFFRQYKVTFLEREEQMEIERYPDPRAN